MSKAKGGIYPVGYGKPPEHSKFRPGQSGNPKGRPRGSLNLATALNRALKEKVTVVENGRRRLVTKLDAAVTQLVNRAVKGDARAVQQMLSLAPLVGIQSEGPTQSLDANDTAVLAGLMKRLGKSSRDTDSND